MAENPLSNLLRQVRRLAERPAADGLEDRCLLERFLDRRDEAAFEALLRRHGPMVLGVCRRLLGNAEDAEDAFQATFLVLVRKGRLLTRRDLLAHWLYGVARRTALKARATRARRQAAERAAPARPPAEAADVLAEAHDVQAVLEEEVGRLPARYRRPMILCYLRGATLTEAARQLGWPAGTVSGRLARARDLLRGRLSRRGITLATAGLAALLAPAEAAPAPLLHVTLRAAGLLRAGQGLAAGGISRPVLRLTEGVLNAMFLNQVKTAAVVLLTLGVLGSGLGLLAYPRLAAQQPAGEKAAPPQPDQPAPAVDPPRPRRTYIQREEPKITELPGLSDEKVKALLAAAKVSDKMKALLKQRYEAARTEARARLEEFVAGRGTLFLLLDSSKSLLEAERDLSDKKADQLTALENYCKRLRDVEEVTQVRYDAGRISVADLSEVRSARLQAEIWLERLKTR